MKFRAKFKCNIHNSYIHTHATDWKKHEIIYLRVICIAFSFTVSPTPVCGRIVIGWGRAWRWSPIWICRASSPITHQGYTAARLWNVKTTYSSEKERTTWLQTVSAGDVRSYDHIMTGNLHKCLQKSIPQHSLSQSKLVSTGFSKNFTSDFVEKALYCWMQFVWVARFPPLWKSTTSDIQ